MVSFEGISVCFLGCGKFGSAILHGVVSALDNRDNGASSPSASSTPGAPIRSLYACVRTATSARRIEDQLGPSSSRINIVVGDNGAAVQAADVVILGCRPGDVRSCLGSDSVRRALKSKLLVSVVAGVSIPDLRAIIADHDSSIDAQTTAQDQVFVVRVMANVAARIRKSITVATMEAPLPSPVAVSHVQWIFDQVGSLMWVDPTLFDAAVTLCSSGPAFVATFLDSLADGALALGIDRQRAVEMAALMAEGTARLILAGQAPAAIRDSVMTPGGSTVQGILEMEERGVRPLGVNTIIRGTNRLKELQQERSRK